MHNDDGNNVSARIMAALYPKDLDLGSYQANLFHERWSTTKIISWTSRMVYTESKVHGCYMSHSACKAIGHPSFHQLEIEAGWALHIPRAKGFCKLSGERKNKRFMCNCLAYKHIREKYTTVCADDNRDHEYADIRHMGHSITRWWRSVLAMCLSTFSKIIPPHALRSWSGS